jgi:hypothetical protein
MGEKMRSDTRTKIFIAFTWVAVGSGFALPAFSAEDQMMRARDGLDRPLDAVKKARRPVSAEPRTTTDGVLPLDEPISIKVRDVLLRVPAAYISPWPHAAARNRINHSSSLRFEFWMPDKRHLEISPLSNADFRPLEPGRGEPGPNAYIVRVWDVRPTRLDEPGYVSPEQAFRNEIKSRQPPGSEYSFHEEEFGLVRFWPVDAPNSTFSVEYRHKEGTDPQVLLDCIVPDRWRVFPECSGRIHFVADDLAFFVVFPREQVSHWRSIVLAARELYKSWIVSP